jgi:hypothetical protein
MITQSNASLKRLLASSGVLRLPPPKSRGWGCRGVTWDACDFVEDQSKIVTVGDLYEAVGNLLGRAP